MEASVSEMGARITLPGFTPSINLDNHTAYKGMWARTAREGWTRRRWEKIICTHLYDRLSHENGIEIMPLHGASVDIQEARLHSASSQRRRRATVASAKGEFWCRDMHNPHLRLRAEAQGLHPHRSKNNIYKHQPRNKDTPPGTLVLRPRGFAAPAIGTALGKQQTIQDLIPALLPWIVLTGSRPSMASIQSLRSSSDRACMVITPGLQRKEDMDMNPVPQVQRSWRRWTLKKHPRHRVRGR